MPLSDCGVQGQWRQTADVLFSAQQGNQHPLLVHSTMPKNAMEVHLVLYRCRRQRTLLAGMSGLARYRLHKCSAPLAG